jgi:hypothetical protein
MAIDHSFSEFARRVAEKVDADIMAESRFTPPPGSQAAARAKGHFGFMNPPCTVDSDFIAREWADACAADIMTHVGHKGMESTESQYVREWKKITR